VLDPIWFAEGMAEHFCYLEWTKRGFKPTGKNWKAAMYGQEIVEIPLTEVLKATRDDLYGIKFPQYYASSWAIVSFLLKKHPEAVEALLLKQPVDLGHLEKEYRQFLKRKLGV
jgi:hypothetical protein